MFRVRNKGSFIIPAIDLRRQSDGARVEIGVRTGSGEGGEKGGRDGVGDTGDCFADVDEVDEVVAEEVDVDALADLRWEGGE